MRGMGSSGAGEEPIAGRYRLARKLGAGAAGEAWLCHDGQSGQEVVVKLLKSERASSATDAERFRREVLALAKVVHPHVVRILGAGTCQRRAQPYFVMSFTPGVSLKQVLRADRRLSPHRALRLACQLLSAVEAFHREGILHRDLKPANLLIQDPGTQRERLAVLDFGLAKHLEGGQRTQAALTGNSVVGTPRYLAPEQCRATGVSPATDVYAVGCILLELLSGRPPFSGSTALEVMKGHCKDAPPRLRERCPELGPELDELVAACLRKEPADRPRANDLRQRLEALQASFDSSEEETIERALTPQQAALLAPDSEPTLRDGRVLPLPAEGGTLLDGAVLALPEDDAGTLLDERVLAGEPLPAGPAARYRLDFAGLGQVFLFAGFQLRFGRRREGNDLLLRAYPRRGESRTEADARSYKVSQQHGRVVLTRRWIALEDFDSTSGTLLAGERLQAGRLYRFPPRFRLSIPAGVELSGSLLPSSDPAAHPVAGLRLERVGEGPSLLYVLLCNELVLGSGAEAAISLRGTAAQHAGLLVREGRLGLRNLAREGATQIDGRALRRGEAVELTPGAQVLLGRQSFRVWGLRAEDMKPG